MSISRAKGLITSGTSPTVHGHCPLLKIMHKTCTPWVQCRNTRDYCWAGGVGGGGAQTCRSFQKREYPSLHGPLVGISFLTNLKSNLCIASIIQNTTENVLLTRTHKTRLLFFPTQCIFNWNLSVYVLKQGTVTFLWHTQQPRSTANSSVLV